MADVISSAELQAKVDAFVNNLLKAANGADKTSSSVGQMSVNISKNIDNVNKLNLNQFNSALNSGSISINRFNQQANSLSASTKPLITGSNQAANALTNLGRVAQD